jgi:hypothetical protein
MNIRPLLWGFFFSPQHSASPAPKADEHLAKAKFYTENGKSEKRPSFGRQSACDCYLPTLISYAYQLFYNMN